jgi:hypothetical protein
VNGDAVDTLDDAQDIDEVTSLLAAAGLQVKRVGPEQTKRCDLRSKDDHERYLVEVKAIHDDAAIGEALRSSGVYARDRWISPPGTMSRRIGAAVKQLQETASEGDDELLLVALVGRARFWSNVLVPQIVGALYGARTLVDLTTPPRAVGKCLYFSHSAFSEHRMHLDGAIIVDASGAGLCVNDHSHRAQRVRDSRLGHFFSSCGLLHDSAKLEREGHFLVADCDIDRSDEHAVLQYVARKYGIERPVSLRSSVFVGALCVT